MDTYVSSIVNQLRSYFDGLLLEDIETGTLHLKDEELGDLASCCTTGEVACFYVLDAMINGGDGHRIAGRLAESVRVRQLPQGAFTQPYYVQKGEPGTIDIAEIGAVANSLFHVYRATGSETSKISLLGAADYLLTQVAAQNSGAVYKNPNARDHDVLNGDIYAAHTWGRAYELTGRESYLTGASRVLEHVNDRFGKHAEGWWPYIEGWDGSIVMGNSVAYQGTIVGFAHTVAPLLPEPLQRSWRKTAIAAVHTMLEAMKDGPNECNEAPWWCRDWNNCWEIVLAYSRFPELPDAAACVEARLKEINQQLSELGAATFRPSARQQDRERTPVTTTFRKAATFAGILGYMMLDDVSPWKSPL